MNIWTKIKSLFCSHHPSKSKHIVIFDGENVNVPAFKKLFKPALNVAYKWVSGTSIPKVVAKSTISVEVPFRHGKESADTHIAMDIMHICHTMKDVTMITLVTNDTDFFDVIGFAGKKFPNVKFVLAVDGTRPYKKISTENLPENASRVIYK